MGLDEQQWFGRPQQCFTTSENVELGEICVDLNEPNLISRHRDSIEFCVIRAGAQILLKNLDASTVVEYNIFSQKIRNPRLHCNNVFGFSSKSKIQAKL